MQEQHLSDFDFELPPELIAQYPLADRAASRLLHITEEVIEDCTFRDIEKFLRPGDLLIANNTRVIKARLLGAKATGGAVEALIERVTGEFTAIAMVRASKSPKPGSKLFFAASGTDLKAEVEVTGRAGEFFELKFAEPVLQVLEAFGRVPLPPYIEHAPEKADESRYQTVYARHPGAVAAPTAGLHFTDDLLNRLKAKGVDIEYVTLESAADRIGHVEAGARDTRLFIMPGYKFRIVDALVTNFHLPKSTLVMLVSALVGRERILEAYAHAVREHYRFFSYGDACFIEKARGA